MNTPSLIPDDGYEILLGKILEMSLWSLKNAHQEMQFRAMDSPEDCYDILMDRSYLVNEVLQLRWWTEVDCPFPPPGVMEMYTLTSAEEFITLRTDSEFQTWCSFVLYQQQALKVMMRV